MSAPLLEARGLTLGVGGRILVRELSVCVNPGEKWCLLGPNGAGKTTLLHTVVGLREPQDGSVQLTGRALEDWLPGEAAQVRGFLPQTTHDAFSASVAEIVLLGRHPYLARWQWEGAGDREIVFAALRAMDLEGFDGRDVLTLSGGASGPGRGAVASRRAGVASRFASPGAGSGASWKTGARTGQRCAVHGTRSQFGRALCRPRLDAYAAGSGAAGAYR